jgi:membrane dipeptidase
MRSRPLSRISLALFVAAGAALVAVPLIGAQQDDAALVARARGIHERVITLDTHDDINARNFTVDCNYTMRLTTQVNLPKMVEGGLDVSFMVVYAGQGPLTDEGYANAYATAIEKFDAVHRLTDEIAPDQIELALTPADVRRIAASGKKVAVIGIENGYSLGTDIGRVKEFFDRGGRYMSLSHNNHSQLSDSNTGERNNVWLHGGVSELGRQVIAEMNRWGMMIDISHPSKASILQTMVLSRAPVIASHSSARALANSSRNLDDEMLMALKANGGVIQTVAFGSYIATDHPDRGAALNVLREAFGLNQAAAAAGRGAGRGGGGRAGGGRGQGTAGPPPCNIEDPNQPAAGRGGRGGRAGGAQSAALEQLSAERRAEYDRRLAVIDGLYPAAGARDVSRFVDHVDYLVNLIGIDHVGISSDFDGGGGVDGWRSASDTFNVTLELVRRGYTEEQIGQIWSGNLLRVWEEVERVAREIQAESR